MVNHFTRSVNPTLNRVIIIMATKLTLQDVWDLEVEASMADNAKDYQKEMATVNRLRSEILQQQKQDDPT